MFGDILVLERQRRTTFECLELHSGFLKPAWVVRIVVVFGGVVE